MKQFFAFVHKEFHHIFRDPRTMLILLLMPVVLIVLFGFAITTEVKNVRMAVYAPTNDESTRQITERFAANRYFTVVGAVGSPDEIEPLFRENKIDMALIFGDGFQHRLMHTGKAAVQLIIDGSEPNTAATILAYASSVLTQYRAEISLSTPRVLAQNRDEISPSTPRVLAQNRDEISPPAPSAGAYTIIPNVRMLFNPQMKSAYNFVPGVMGLILMLICAMMTSISIVREKERGTMEVLLVSPMRPAGILMAKVVPYFCISTVNVATILLLAVFVLGVPVAGSLFWIATLSLVYIFVALALGILISSLVSTQVAAMLASGMGLMLPTMILSGMIFPVENMPAVLRWLTNIIPARWYIAGIRELMIEGLPIRYALKELAILSLMGTILISASLKLFKNRLQ